MPSATITLKLAADEKKRLQARARREKKSLNAYLLDRIAQPDRPPSARPDYAALNSGLHAKLGSLEIWRSIDDLR